MPTSTLTSKGQITLPADLRRQWQLKAGDQVVFDEVGKTGGRIEPKRRRSIFEMLPDMQLPSLGRPLMQADIDNAIGEAMLEQELRVRKSGST